MRKSGIWAACFSRRRPAPLRNPQRFVPNIFDARPGDFRKAEITILRSASQPSAVLLPVVPSHK